MSKPRERIGIYPGSFDPVTYGHEDIMRQASGLVDRLIVAIGSHPQKRHLISLHERIALVEASCQRLKDEGVETTFSVIAFDDLLIMAAARERASCIIRGVRDEGDMAYELRMAEMNRVLSPDLLTLFIPSSAPTRAITATLVRQIAAMKGDVSPFVAPDVVHTFDRLFRSP